MLMQKQAVGHFTSGKGNPFGVSLGAVNRDPRLTPRSLELAGQADIGWVRTGFWYNILNPRPGFFRFRESGYDALVAKIRQEGMQIVGMLGYSTAWNTTAPANPPPGLDIEDYPPRDYEAFSDYVSEVVRHYRNEVQYWEVWNEPDLRGFWAGTAEQYAHLLAVTYQTVKRVNPSAQVLLGGVALEGGGPGGIYRNRTFLTDILNDRRYPAAKHFDIMNFHSYGTREEMRQRMDYVRRALSQANAGAKPIWVTETGYSSDPARQHEPQYQGLEGQARWLRERLPYILDELGAEKVFWFQLYDYLPTYTRDSAFSKHGLIDATGKPKPAYNAYRDLIHQYKGQR